MVSVPVVDKEGRPLMPTTPSRARRWTRSKRATPFWDKGIWCIRLNEEPSARETQPVALGIDPGSKRHGLTVASVGKAFLHIQADAVTWVKEHMATRRAMRRGRRYRNSPCRQPRQNRRQGQPFVPPSTKARWQWLLRLATWLKRLYPISHIAVEDVKATLRKGKGRKWNRAFSPLHAGKAWLYRHLENLTSLHLFEGHETAAERECLGLKKSSQKMAETFTAHCVDSWALTRLAIGGVAQPDQTCLLRVVPLRFHRRQLHRLQPERGNIRKTYGGTRSLGFTRGSYVEHPKYGLCYVGGTFKGRISLHAARTGKRLTQNARPIHCRFRTYGSWRSYGVPT